MSEEFKERGGLRKHQSDAVWRILSDNATYLGHEVGTGKTMALVAAAMEARRLGIARRPLVTVPNDKVEDFAHEFRTLYPNSKILVASVPAGSSTTETSKIRRKRVIAQMALNDWDAIIMNHDSFEGLQVSPQMKSEVLRNEISIVRQALEAAESEGSGAASDIQSALESLEDNLRDEQDRITKKTDVSTFEETGVDMVLVDEAHRYKNLYFASRLGRDVKGISARKTGRSREYHHKTEYLHKSKGRIVMASGTPLSNSVGELYNISRYLQPEALKERNLQYFDNWAAAYGEIGDYIEYAPQGGTFKRVTKFNRFKNFPELMQMVMRNMDLVSARKIGLKRPKVYRGGAQMIAAEKNWAQEDYQTELNGRAEYIQKNPIEARPDNMLVVSGDGRNAAIDMRMVSASYPEIPGGKIDKMLPEVKKIYDETTHFKGTQVIFLDRIKGTKANPDFVPYQFIKGKLAEMGIPESEIAATADITSTGKKQKKAFVNLYNRVNKGEVRVLLATTQKGGTGVNFQRLISGIHHLDVDWNLANYEQRNGRGLRQGNLAWDLYKYELRIFNYSTEATVDAFMWEKVKQKAEVFQQFLAGDLSQREIADISDDVVTPSEMMAIASGDPMVAEQVRLTHERTKLNQQKYAFDKSQAFTRRELIQYQQQIPGLEQRAAVAREAEKFLGGVTKLDIKGAGSFEVKGIEGVEDKTIETWSKHVRALIRKGENALKKQDVKHEITFDVGTIHGAAGETRKVELLVRRLWTDDFSRLLLIDGADPGNPFLRIDNQLKNLKESSRKNALAAEKLATRRTEKDIPELESQLKKSWPKVDQLQKVKERLTVIQAYYDKQNNQGVNNMGTTEEVKAAPKKMVARRPGDQVQLSDEKVAEITARLNSIIERVAPGADVSYTTRPGPDGSIGTTNGTLITLSLSARNPETTLGHEAIHYLRNVDVILPGEWATLEAAARRQKWIKKYNILERYPHLYRDGKPTRAVMEEAISEAFGDFVQNQVAVAETETIFQKVRNLLGSIGRYLRRAFGNQELAAVAVFDAIYRGEIGARRAADLRQGPVQQRRTPGKDPGFEFLREEEEASWTRGKEETATQTLGEKVKSALHDFGQRWVRTHKDLPRTPEFSNFTDWLRQLNASYNHSIEEVVTHLNAVTKGLTAREVDLFSRLVYLNDLMDDVRREIKELPIFGDHESFLENYNRFSSFLSSKPELEKKLRSRLAVRNAKVRALAKEMYEAGVLGKEALTRRNYITHLVLDYWAAKSQGSDRIKGIRSPSKSVRFGTTKDINTDFLTVEAHWMMGAYRDIAQKQVINKLEKSTYNQKSKLRSQVRTHNQALSDLTVADEARAAFQEAGIQPPQVTTYKEVDEALKNLSPGDQADLKKNMPIYTRLKNFSLTMAINFKVLKSNLARESIPEDLHPELEALKTGAKSGVSVRPLLQWLQQNDEGVAGQAATKILLAGIQRHHFLRKSLKEWIPSNDDSEAMRRLGEEWADYDVFQPKKGNFLVRAQTVTQKALDMMTARFQDVAAEEGVFPIEEISDFLASVKPQLVLGGPKYQMPLKKEIVATLENYGHDDLQSESVMLYREGIRMWKIWTLLNPTKFVKYSTGNISGDGAKVIGSYPKALGQLPRAWRELSGVMYKGGQPSEAYELGKKHGVHDSGWSMAEVHSMQKEFRRLLDDPSFKEGVGGNIRRAFGRVIAETKKANTFRENLLRYSVFLHLIEAIPKAKAQARDKLGKTNVKPEEYLPIVGYGGGNWKYANTLENDTAIAAYLARETLGDYADVSQATKHLRRYWMPFFSWQEVNTKYYFRLLFHNIPAQVGGYGNAKTLLQAGAGVGMQAAVATAFLNLGWMMIKTAWNVLFHRDEYDELSEEDQVRMSPIIGRTTDGKVLLLRAPGAVADFMGWVGFEDVAVAARAVLDGRGTWSDVLRAMYGAPIDKFWNGVTPVFKVPYEIATGQSTFPSFLKSRSAVDRYKTFFQAFSLDHPYEKLRGRPTKGWGEWFVNWFVDQRDPKMNAYFKVRGWGYDFKRNEGAAGGGISDYDAKSRAYYYYRMSLLRGERGLASGYREKLLQLGVGLKGMRGLHRRMHPLGMLSMKQRRKFVMMLKPDDRKSLRRAIYFYAKAFGSGGASSTQQ